jgi:uncharacterized protein YjiK
MKKILPLIVLIALCSGKKVPLLKPYFHHDINIAEPSDICLSPTDPSHFYIVSNRGCIAETDSSGKILRQTKYDGSDYEGICIKDNMIYALDESLRRVDILNESDFKLKKSVYINYSGARNKGFEGIVYMPDQKKFIAVIEKPAMIFELNEQLQVLSATRYKQFYELSSVTYHDHFLWLLGDEQHLVMKVNPEDYSIVNSWNLPVINPEGICFDKDNNLLIVSDDMSELFKFKMPNP